MMTKEQLDKIVNEMVSDHKKLSNMLDAVWNCAHNERNHNIADAIEKIQDQFGLFPNVNHETAVLNKVDDLYEVLEDNEKLRDATEHIEEFIDLRHRMEIIGKLATLK